VRAYQRWRGVSPRRVDGLLLLLLQLLRRGAGLEIGQIASPFLDLFRQIVMACLSWIRPALTKPRVATVTALEDCTREVMVTPARMPRRLVRVELSRMRCRALPEARRRPLVIRYMPNRKRPTPPSRLLTIVKSIKAPSNLSHSETIIVSGYIIFEINI